MRTMFKIRQRNCLLIVGVLVLAPCVIILMIMGPELSTEQSLTQRLAECHMRLQYLESMYRARQEDVSLLSQYLGQLQSSSNQSGQPTTAPMPPQFGPVASLLDALSPEARQLLRNASHPAMAAMRHHANGGAAGGGNGASIRLPNAYHFLPHLLDDSGSLRPAYLLSKGRSDVSVVLGVPTVRREKQSYLVGTLHNLIENMNELEQNETLIIVYIGETDGESVQLIAKQIVANFEFYIENGLIDIIAPAASYYPNFEQLHLTLNDSLERVKWRSKQNLDFAYLMAYAQSKGTFYVQLEDDILTKRQFITTMKQFALQKSALTKPQQPAWFVLDFCQLGFIGKMFKSAELPYLITYFQMFYNDKPVDWLLTYFIESKVCRTDKDQKHCNQEKAKYWQHYRKSLFQHIGTSSSLKGKVQRLKDKQFGNKVPAYYAHPHNPPARCVSNIAPYKNFQLARAYRGESYFWGLLPQPGDLVQFIFEQPTALRKFLIRSGNSEHPSDRFYNTTVEVLPGDALGENSSVWSIYNTTADGFLIVGAFDPLGVAEGLLDPKIGAVKELRLHVHGESENWVLLSEIELQVAAAAATNHSVVTASTTITGDVNGNEKVGGKPRYSPPAS